MDYYSVRDGKDCLIGEYDRKDDAINRAEECKGTVYLNDLFAVATF
jgi:hypothetical protein